MPPELGEQVRKTIMDTDGHLRLLHGHMSEEVYVTCWEKAIEYLRALGKKAAHLTYLERAKGPLRGDEVWRIRELQA